MPKINSDRTKNIKLYINLDKQINSVHQEIIVECKLVLEAFSFHMLSAWEKYQIVDINIQGLSMVSTGVSYPHKKWSLSFAACPPHGDFKTFPLPTFLLLEVQ